MKIISPKSLALASLIVGAATSEAKVIYVNGDMVGTVKDGKSWATAFRYLRDALANATADDSIYLAKGTYFPDQADTIAVDFGYRDEMFTFSAKGLKLYGGFAGTETNLSQRNITANPTILSGRIWDGPNEEIYSSIHVTQVEADATMDGVTVQDGNANGYLSWVFAGEPYYNSGGACYVINKSKLTLENCIFTNNTAFDNGGAIMLEGGTGNGSVFAKNCKFISNKVTTSEFYNQVGVEQAPTRHPTPFGAGGAICGDVSATDCEFNTNSVTAIPYPSANNPAEGDCTARGGAISGVVDALRCKFSGNTATSTQANLSAGRLSGSYGGAIYGTTTMRECSFSGNSAVGANITNVESRGGAINGIVTATKCSLVSNNSSSSRSYGGAIMGSSVSSVNCNFVTNTAGPGFVSTNGETLNGGGGAVFVTTGTSALTNCVFFQNTSQFIGGAVAMFDPIYPGDAKADFGSVEIWNSTLVDNGVAAGGSGGAAIAAAGWVSILNNLIWNSTASSGTFSRNNLISARLGGVLRNVPRQYPAPINFALNLVNGGSASIARAGGFVYLGSESSTLVNGNPQFVNLADPDGADNIYGTTDDGLKIGVGSAAIRTLATETTRGITVPYDEFIAKDVQDIDDDGNVAEGLPADFGGYVRIQDTYIDLGAYEFGPLRHIGDIQVEQPVGTVLPAGTSTIDFGAVSGIPVTKTVTIKNTGVANLTGIVVSISGPNVGDFSFTQPRLTTIPAGGSTTFDLTFGPKADGLRSMTLQVVSSDPDESPYVIAVQGQGATPDIAVEQPAGSDLADGSAAVDFGVTSVGSKLSRTFTIRNTGTGHLGITAINVAGANSSDFKAFLPASKVVAPGGTTTFKLDFTPSGTGDRNATVSILSNDPDAESSFDINVTGTGTNAPEIQVTQPILGQTESSWDIASGGSRSYGSVKRLLNRGKEYTITNVGNQPLKNISVSISGDADFILSKPDLSQLAGGASTVFNVFFHPTSLGSKTAVVKIKSNDSDENPFVINVSGTGISASAATKIALSSIVKKSSNLVADQGGKVTVRSDADGLSYLVLTIEKSDDWALTNHRVEVSGNLVDWYSGKKHTKVLVDDDSTLRVQDKTPVSPEKKRYIRLK